MIYGIPHTGTTVLKLDPFTDTSVEIGTVDSASNKWVAGGLAPNGLIYGLPFSRDYVLVIDPQTDTVSEFDAGSRSGAFAGCTLAPNGSLYGIPYDSTTVGKVGEPVDIPLDFALSRYWN
jgi:hypothetical protein